MWSLVAAAAAAAVVKVQKLTNTILPQNVISSYRRYTNLREELCIPFLYGVFSMCVFLSVHSLT